MASKAVSNTGPIIHLQQINLTKSLNIFNTILIPPEVKQELTKNKVAIPKKVKITEINAQTKDITNTLVYRLDLDLGEAQAIALALQEKVDYFLTDDLDARTISKSHNIKTHGTAGIILRSFREKRIDKDTAIKKVNELYTNSTLFITRDLINKIIKSINEYSEK